MTGAGYVASDLGWLRALAADERRPPLLRDESDEVACVGLWGPAAPAVLTEAAGGLDVAELAPRTAHEIRLGGATIVAVGVSYAGEAGWELYVEPEWAVQAWDRLVEAGRDRGLEIFGYRALESLRVEKGFRYYGTDLTMLDSPVEAGMLRFVAFDKGPFIGREALIARRDAGPPPTRLRTVLIGPDGEWRPVYGGEAVRVDGDPVGRLRSAGYGHTVGRTLGYVYLPSHLGLGAEVEVDVFAERVGAVVVPDAVVPSRPAAVEPARA